MIFADLIDDALPGWMRFKPFEHWRKLAGVIALVADAMVDGIYEARLAALPGQVKAPGIPGLGGFDNVDALPLIGRDRGIAQGFMEPPWDYARRLVGWRDRRRGRPSGGSSFGLLWQLRGILGPAPFPVVRTVNHNGHWHSIEADGSLVYNTPTGAGGFRINPTTGIISAEPTPAHPWDWDSADFPPGSLVPQDKFRSWVIIYAPTSAPLDATEGVWGYGTTSWGEIDATKYGSGPYPSAGTWGTHSTAAHVDLIRGLVAAWKPAGIVVPHIITAFDPASFDPLTPGPYPAAGMPNGTWGHDGKLVAEGGRIRRHATRLSTARYWKGKP